MTIYPFKVSCDDTQSVFMENFVEMQQQRPNWCVNPKMKDHLIDLRVWGLKWRLEKSLEICSDKNQKKCGSV